MNAKRVIAILIACLVVVANIMLFSEELTGVFRGLLFSKFSSKIEKHFNLHFLNYTFTQILKYQSMLYEVKYD